MNVTEVIADMLESKFGVEQDTIHSDAPLRSLGLDSLALEELRVMIEEEWQIDLEDTALSSRETVGQLENVVRGKAAA